MDSDIIIKALLCRYFISKEDGLTVFAEAMGINIDNGYCVKKNAAGIFEINYIEIILQNASQENKFILSEKELYDIFNDSKENIVSNASQVGIGKFDEPLAQVEPTKYKISVEKIKKKLDIDESKIIKKSSNTTNDFVSIDIESNMPYFLDFWWEKLSTQKLHVKRIYNKNKKTKIDSDFAAIFISRGRDHNMPGLNESMKKETNHFFLESFIEKGRQLFINNLFISFFHEKAILFRRKLNILHIIGHGDGNYFFAETDSTDDDPTKFKAITNLDLVKRFKRKKINIVNLAFCFSAYNDVYDKMSLPVIFLDNGIANHVVSSKGGTGTDFFLKFNQCFYNQVIQKGKNVSESFFFAKDKIEKDYENSVNSKFIDMITLFESNL